MLIVENDDTENLSYFSNESGFYIMGFHILFLCVALWFNYLIQNVMAKNDYMLITFAVMILFIIMYFCRTLELFFLLLFHSFSPQIRK